MHGDKGEGNGLIGVLDHLELIALDQIELRPEEIGQPDVRLHEPEHRIGDRTPYLVLPVADTGEVASKTGL